MNPQKLAQLQRLQQFSCFVEISHENLTASQLLLLATIAEEPGLPQRELAERIGRSAGAISRSVDTLGTSGRRGSKAPGLGWITIKSDPADDRTKRVYLTDAGETAVSAMLGMLWP